MVEVKEVVTKVEWKVFAAFPIKLYKDCPYYVPAFQADDRNMADPKKNTAAVDTEVKAFLAYKNGEVVGRIAAIIVNESNRVFNQKRVRFSRFDVIDDVEVSVALFDAVAKFAKSRGLNEIHGPWGFNDTDREGMLTEGYDRISSYATNYNYPYYNDHMSALGFKQESVWVESKVVFPKAGERLYDKYVKLGEYTKRKYGLRELCESMSVKQIIKKYGDKFFDCFNAAYSSLDMFIEIKDEAKKAVLNQFAIMINKDFLSLLVDENDDIVAFCVILPSFGWLVKKYDGKMTLPFIVKLFSYLKNPDALELTLMAVRPEYQKRGYNAGCFSRILKNVSDNGIKTIVSCPTLESNTAIRAQWDALEHEIIKRRQTYIKKI